MSPADHIELSCRVLEAYVRGLHDLGKLDGARNEAYREAISLCRQSLALGDLSGIQYWLMRAVTDESVFRERPDMHQAIEQLYHQVYCYPEPWPPRIGDATLQIYGPKRM